MREHPTKVLGDFAENFYWYDTGDIGSIILATKKLLDLEKQTVLIAKNCIIDPTAKIGPHVVIGNNCTIEKNTQISSSVLLDNSTVKENTVLTNTLYWQ